MATGPDGGKAPAPALRLPGDRATAPVPLEDSSDTAWEEFSQLQSRSDSGTSDPVPVAAATPAAAAARPPHEPVTVVSTMLLARSGNRVCPVAAPWAELSALLPSRDGKAPPAAFNVTEGSRVSPIQKRLRLRDQIEWAAATGCLPQVHRFLAGLPEGAWEHFEGS